MLAFVRDLSSKFDIGTNKIRIGTEIFSDRTYIQFNLNRYNDSASLDKAIANIPYKRGTTNTGQALKVNTRKNLVLATNTPHILTVDSANIKPNNKHWPSSYGKYT